jgi:hypothetical protein
MRIRRIVPQNLVQLTEWRINQPQTQDWIKHVGLTEETAGRVVSQILRPAVQALSRFFGDTEPQVIAEISSGGVDCDAPLYGLCDHIHMMHLDILKWIHATLDQVPIPPEKAKVGITKSPFHSVLDYYGKTGELALRIARDTKCDTTFVEQGTWAEYALYRAKLYKLSTKIKVEEAFPGFPRPHLDDERFGMIVALEAPLTVDKEWLDWVKVHLLPYGFIASKAEFDWKKVAKLNPYGYIYQYIP